MFRPEDIILYKSLGKREKDIAAISFMAEDNPLDRRYLERYE